MMRANEMSVDGTRQRPDLFSNLLVEKAPRTAASYEQELTMRRNTEAQLRKILAKGEYLLHQKDEAIEYQASSVVWPMSCKVPRISTTDRMACSAR